MRRLIPLLIALGSAGPALAADPAPVIGADRDMAAMSAAKGTRAAFAAYFAPSVTMQSSGALHTGPTAQMLAKMPADAAAFQLDWQPVGGAMSEDGTLGVTWGTWTQKVGGHPAGEGAYTTVWQKQDGRWRVIQEGGSDRPPLGGPLPGGPPQPGPGGAPRR